MNDVALVLDRLLIIAAALPPDGDLELAISDPFERDGLSAEGLVAIGWLEGLADSYDLTVLDLIESCNIAIDRVHVHALQNKNC